MEKLTVAVVFCALVITVLVNDSRGQNDNHPCSKDCKHETALMTFTLNAHSGLYMTCNVTAKTAALLDYTYDLQVLFNGKTGAAVIFHYETGECMLIPQGTSNKTWYAKDKTIQEFMKTMPPTSELSLIGQQIGYQFDPQTSRKDFNEVIATILRPLSVDWTDKCAALGTALQIPKITSDKLKTSLHGFERVMGFVDTPIRGDLKWLVGCFQGFANFFENFPGGINILNLKYVRLNLSIILNAKTGIHILSYLLKELAPHFLFLGRILGKALNPVYSFFVLINNLSGHINRGFDGFICVLRSILQFIRGENSEQNVLIELQGYFNRTITGNNDLGQTWIASIQDLQQTVIKIKLQDCEEFKKRLDDILKKQWIERGVDMNDIIELILAGGPNASENIVAKLKQYLAQNGS